MWIFLIFLIFQEINCKAIKSDHLFRLPLQEQCSQLCHEEKLPVIYPYLKKFFHFHENTEIVICRIGCQFFDIQLGGGLDVNPAFTRCQIGCEQNFKSEGEANICNMGCERMASRVQKRIQSTLVMTPQERYRHDLVIEPENDRVEVDLLSDPSIISQLEVGFNVDYKIPETHIRTMPIEEKSQPTNIAKNKPKDTGDWLDCASKNSGIPKWILLSTMLGAVMIAIWLTLSMESRKGHEECDDELLVEIPNEKHTEDFVIEKDAALFESVAFEDAPEIVNVKFLPPPKYSEVTATDNSGLPNYAKAVENQNTDEQNA